MAFISTDALGGYLRRDLANDDLAEFAVEAACDLIKRLTGQELEYVEGDEITLDGNGGRFLLLPQLPVVEVSTVTVDGTELDPEDYVLHTNGTLSKAKGGWTWGRDNIAVEYSHGYPDTDHDETTMPFDLMMLATTIAARVYDQGLVQQESVGGYQAIYSVAAALDLSSGEKAIIAKYRRGR